MVSAWACENNIVLGQVKTNQKSNQITAIPESYQFYYDMRQVFCIFPLWEDREHLQSKRT